jgi:flagellum-specific ATP synthase
LVERSGRTSRGSISAFYTVLVEGDDNNEPIADALRGLLDGHIVLSRALAEEAHWPPIDLLRSLSRLQPQLVSQEVHHAVAQARQHLSEYRRHADLISIGAYRVGTDPRVDAAIAMRDPLRRFLTQEASQTTTLQGSQAELIQLLRGPVTGQADPSSQPGTASPRAVTETSSVTETGAVTETASVTETRTVTEN